MGFLLLVLILVLVATIGFWDTLAALLGAALLTVLAIVLGGALLALGGWMFLNRMRGGQ